LKKDSFKSWGRVQKRYRVGVQEPGAPGVSTEKKGRASRGKKKNLTRAVKSPECIKPEEGGNVREKDSVEGREGDQWAP